MNDPRKNGLRRALAFGLAIALPLAGSSRVAAFSEGITSPSFSADGGCNDCHSGGTAPSVTLLGPTSVEPGSTHQYTLVIGQVGDQTRGGLNVAAPAGTLATGGVDAVATQLLFGAGGRNEITHLEPKAGSGGETRFSFLWTAPPSFTSLTLTAWGNAVNGNVAITGDRAARALLEIVAAGQPTPGPTPTPTATAPTATPSQTPGDRLADPIRRTIRRGVAVRLEPVASGFDAPVAAMGAPGIAGSLYVVDQSGVLYRVDTTTGGKSVFLDVRSRLVALGIVGPGTYDERGFLGAAFHPDYASNGLVYTYTSEPATAAPDFSTMPPGVAPDHQSVVSEWHVPSPSSPESVVDPASAREILRIDQPQFNHNGGALQFGPDGLLYIALGDGGGADDQDGQPFIGGPVVGHGANGNAQNLGTVLGKILRIDPQGTGAANGRYGIPADNPFVGVPGALAEIWAYGLRNPFRIGFDAARPHLYVGDVGQNDVEEVNVVLAGGNYGWRHKEGRFHFRPNGPEAGYVSRKKPKGLPADFVDPVAQYDRDEGISVIGGFVSHSPSLPRLEGHYVFGDFARTFSNDGRLLYLKNKSLVRKSGQLATSVIAEVRYPDGATSLGFSLLGFGQGNDLELYVLGNTTAAPAGATGVVLRLTEP